MDQDLKRAVVTLHCLPLGDGPADRVRELVRGRRTLGEALDALEHLLPAWVAGARAIVAPLADPRGRGLARARAMHRSADRAERLREQQLANSNQYSYY